MNSTHEGLPALLADQGRWRALSSGVLDMGQCDGDKGQLVRGGTKARVTHTAI